MSRPLKIQTESVTHAQPKKKTATDLPGRRIHSRGEVGWGASDRARPGDQDFSNA
jgi:hypothetical protein